MRARLAILLILLLPAVALAGCGQPEAAPSSARSAQAAQAAAEPFDHTIFDTILEARVSDGKVDYQALKAHDADALQRYLDALAAADPEAFTGPDDDLAFWLNAYNACVIQGVIERYPLQSVMDVPDFFKEKRWRVAGSNRSLDEIENGIIRPTFEDPRIHFILVCAAQSCPPLQPRAMNPATLQADLDRATRSAVNDARYVQVDPRAKRLRLTRIMNWYKKDFVQKDGSLDAFLLRYLDEPARGRLAQGGYTIEFMDYDWDLNDAGSAATK